MTLDPEGPYWWADCYPCKLSFLITIADVNLITDQRDTLADWSDFGGELGDA